ncbi:hypothetical protein EDB84DRAFT_1562286 [Lactarius hengduanensis]|nr:hypothetical protein EDB84DRAFT_1562286 [Lactarius hengduanensis]
MGDHEEMVRPPENNGGNHPEATDGYGNGGAMATAEDAEMAEASSAAAAEATTTQRDSDEADHRAATYTRDFQTYYLKRRGERNVPILFLGAARWRQYRGDEGYFVDFASGPTRFRAVEFNFEHSCWVEVTWNPIDNRWDAVRPAGRNYNCDIDARNLPVGTNWGPIDGAPTEDPSTSEPHTEAPSEEGESENEHTTDDQESDGETNQLVQRAELLHIDEPEVIRINPPEMATETITREEERDTECRQTTPPCFERWDLTTQTHRREYSPIAIPEADSPEADSPEADSPEENSREEKHPEAEEIREADPQEEEYQEEEDQEEFQEELRQPRRGQPSSSRATETDYYAQEPEVEARAGTTAPPQQRANNWLKGIQHESDEVKDLVLQEIWGKEGFQDA